MKTKSNDIFAQNTVFAWIALATGLLLLIPYGAMQITNKVNWTLSDFLIMGVLIFAMGSAFILAARKFPKNRLVLAVIIGLFFLYLWAELAVGIFTSWGS